MLELFYWYILSYEHLNINFWPFTHIICPHYSIPFLHNTLLGLTVFWFWKTIQVSYQVTFRFWTILYLKNHNYKMTGLPFRGLPELHSKAKNLVNICLYLKFFPRKLAEVRWNQDAHLENFKYFFTELMAAIELERIRPLFQLRSLPVSILAYVKVEAWQNTSPWRWLLHGCGSAALTPSCSLCSSS